MCDLLQISLLLLYEAVHPVLERNGNLLSRLILRELLDGLLRLLDVVCFPQIGDCGSSQKDVDACFRFDAI
jgi:hypothetical protein